MTQRQKGRPTDKRKTAGDTKADRDKERQSCRDSWIGGAARQRQVDRRDRGRGTESRLDRLVVGWIHIK